MQSLGKGRGLRGLCRSATGGAGMVGRGCIVSRAAARQGVLDGIAGSRPRRYSSGMDRRGNGRRASCAWAGDRSAMTSPIVDLRNIDMRIWKDDSGHVMCRISTRLPNGKVRPLEFEIDASPKLFQALQIIGE